MTPINKYTKLASILATSLIVCAVPARSQEQATTNSQAVYELDDYLYVANRTEVPAHLVGSTVYTVESQQLEAGNKTFLLEVLRDIPGIHLSNSGGPGTLAGITTRGLRDSRPNILIDGIEVNNPIDGSLINFGTLATNSVASVEILKGPQSALYGADSTAGAISITTISSIDREGGQASVSYGAYNTYTAGARYNARFDRLSFSISANHYETDGYSTQDTSIGPQWADNDGYRNQNFTGRIGFDLSESAELSLTALYIDSYAEYDPGAPSPWAAQDNHSENEQSAYKLSGAFGLTEAWDTDLNIAYSNINNAYYSGGPPYASESNRLTYSWNNQVQLGEHYQIVAGAEYENEDAKSLDRERDNYSYYVENIFYLTTQFTATAAARYDENSAYGSSTTWRATTSYQFERGPRLHASYATSFHAPDFFELYSPWGSNPDLQPEEGEGWDLGIDHSFGDGMFYVSVVGFGNDISDKIQYVGWIPENVSSYESRGTESIIKYRPIDALAFTLAHTYTDAKIADGSSAPRVPEHTASLRADWYTLDQTLNIGASLRYVDSQLDRVGGAINPEYSVVDINAKFDLSETLEIWLRVDNLLDEDYQEVLTYNTAGLSAYGGVNFDF